MKAALFSVKLLCSKHKLFEILGEPFMITLIEHTPIIMSMMRLPSSNLKTRFYVLFSV